LSWASEPVSTAISYTRRTLQPQAAEAFRGAKESLTGDPHSSTNPTSARSGLSKKCPTLSRPAFVGEPADTCLNTQDGWRAIRKFVPEPARSDDSPAGPRLSVPPNSVVFTDSPSFGCIVKTVEMPHSFKLPRYGVLGCLVRSSSLGRIRPYPPLCVASILWPKHGK